jgi:uncharacterized DUF497 family protein
VKFEFDAAKSASNKSKHRLDFVDAQALWMDANRARARQKRHSASASFAARITVIEDISDHLDLSSVRTFAPGEAETLDLAPAGGERRFSGMGW